MSGCSEGGGAVFTSWDEALAAMMLFIVLACAAGFYASRFIARLPL